MVRNVIPHTHRAIAAQQSGQYTTIHRVDHPNVDLDDQDAEACKENRRQSSLAAEVLGVLWAF